MQPAPLNSSDFKRLNRPAEASAQERILRIVLAIAVDGPTAAECGGWSTEAPVTRWPSTLYRVLAAAAVDSPRVWRRCARALDETLGETIAQYRDYSPVELAGAFLEGRESLCGDELAALLWCLMRERSSHCDLVAERLGKELEVVAARRLHTDPLR